MITCMFKGRGTTLACSLNLPRWPPLSHLIRDKSTLWWNKASFWRSIRIAKLLAAKRTMQLISRKTSSMGKEFLTLQLNWWARGQSHMIRARQASSLTWLHSSLGSPTKTPMHPSFCSIATTCQLRHRTRFLAKSLRLEPCGHSSSSRSILALEELSWPFCGDIVGSQPSQRVRPVKRGIQDRPTRQKAGPSWRLFKIQTKCLLQLFSLNKGVWSAGTRWIYSLVWSHSSLTMGWRIFGHEWKRGLNFKKEDWR